MGETQYQSIDPETLFQTNLAVVDRVARQVCRSARMRLADETDDFVSTVMVALLEDDYAILRKWQGRGSLPGYLSVVIRRLLADHRDHERGRWYPSAEATRGGAAGMLLEKLLVRDCCSFAEAVPRVRQIDPVRSSGELAAMAERFPKRPPRLRAVDLDAVAETSMLAPDRADERVLDREAKRLARLASEVVRSTVASWPDEDAMVFRLRFGASMTIAEIARMLDIPQRALYRRVEVLRARLRAALLNAGLEVSVLEDLIGDASHELDFGLACPMGSVFFHDAAGKIEPHRGRN